MSRRLQLQFTVNWKYAIGELTLIVSGVTLALAGNAWYQTRSNNQLEAVYIERLLNSLQTDVERFSGSEVSMTIKSDVLRTLRSGDLEGLLSVEPDQLLDELRYSAWGYLPPSDRSTFDELVSTGNLTLIENYQLRGDLAWYYNEYEFARELANVRLGSYRAIFDACFSDINYLRQIKKEDAELSIIADALECLSSSANFQENVRLEISYAMQSLDFYGQFLAHAKGLIRDLSGTR